MTRYVSDNGDIRAMTPAEEAEIDNMTVAVPKVQTVTMRQARLALLQAGYYAVVNNAIATMPGAAGDAARIEWDYASTVERGSSITAAMAAMLALNEEEMDTLFSTAATL
jgi:hypothetical protein